MANISYRIRGDTDNAGIKIRFRKGKKYQFEISTGLKIKRRDWSTSKQKVKNTVVATYKDVVNYKLLSLKTFIFDEFYRDDANGIKISQEWLKSKVYTHLGKTDIEEYKADIYFLSFIKWHIEESKKRDNRLTGKKLSLRTIQSYETTLIKLDEYEKENDLKLKILDINLSFHSKFISFLNNRFKLNPNTIGGYIDNIKAFCRSAELKGIQINIEIKSRDFYSPQNKTNDIYLDENEINSIFNLDLNYSARLGNARDWLIIGLWTGLRVSDLLKLNKNNLKNDFIHVTTFKTSTPVVIAIHGHIKEILENRGGEFPNLISDQKFNEYIKEVCKLSGINRITEGSKITALDINGKKVYRKTNGRFPKYELVSSHICRRSFATNLYGKINTYTIMQITGHKSERQFLEYIKTTSTEHAEKLKEFWGKTDE